MDKKKHRSLLKWLRSQNQLAKSWMMATVALAFTSGLLLLAQAALLANILHQLIMEQTPKSELISSFIGLAVIVCVRAFLSWAKEQTGYRAGEVIRLHIRKLILDKLHALGPATIHGKPAGSWASLILEQVEEMQDFFARYMPQMSLAVLLPFIILVAVFPINWAAGLIFLITAPLVPLFMALVGMGAADANRRNFKAMQRLSGHFYDRLRGLSTIRLLDHAEAETVQLRAASDDFRRRTMEVLRMAFLSSAVLEFFTAISIAITAVYFGFSFLGELDFGHYGVTITLFTAVFVLVLAPEFYQPLRDLGTYYHAKAQAIGAAESIVNFLNADPEGQSTGTQTTPLESVTIEAVDCEVVSPDGVVLAGPMTFRILPGQQTVLVGPSGAGKTSLMNAVLGFLPYRGSLKINGIELRDLSLAHWRSHISWVGQNPQLFHGTLRDNIVLANPEASDDEVKAVSKAAFADEFIQRLEKGDQHPVGDRASGISVGQAQRIAVARALLQNGSFWLLDEPTASLDANSEKLVLDSLKIATQGTTTLMISHRLDELHNADQVWVMENGQLVQQGKFSDLKEQGLLAEMYNSIDRSDLDA
ncbi:heme ABC transporter permease/ATP-binding protein CydD [Veronia pacifica]|uniref:Thiol reductant ABC exporter subunit CydD n=1 Tax=Veronia pacifica TaxID=1080227 RepID=A0A1C3EM13_9GAMM|nr:cysteine/glutathione ABC transporter permease/ATP-binding protein CydD [Veronia pacifica]ODA34270.1 thiol reductant ABC exporter subunit CydD [Veronia pacifica]